MSTASTDKPKVSKPLLIALGVLAVAALVYLLVVLPNQGGGVGEVDQAEAPVPSESAAGSEVPAGDEGNETDARPQEPSFEVFSARDPFEQLVSDADPAPVGGTTDTGATTPTDGTAPALSAPVGGTDPSGSTPAPGGGQTTVGTTTIALEDVFAEDGVDKVNLVINGEGYEAAEDDTVADVTVLDIEGSCATMRYEDTRFILCEGEHVQK